MHYDGLHFPGTSGPVPTGGNIYLVCNCWYLVYSFCFYQPPQEVPLHGLYLENELDRLTYTCFISGFHTKERRISRGPMLSN